MDRGLASRWVTKLQPNCKNKDLFIDDIDGRFTAEPVGRQDWGVFLPSVDQLVCIFDHPDLIERCGYWFKPAQKIHGN